MGASLAAFWGVRKIAKAAITFIIYVCLPVRPSARPHGTKGL